MTDSTAAGAANQGSELGALLRAVALGVGRRQGRQLWGGLADVVNAHSDARAGHGASAVAELTALGEKPDDRGKAEALARTLLDWAHHDPAFGQDLGTWLGQDQVQTIRRTVSGQPLAASAWTLAGDPTAKPDAGPTRKSDTAAEPAQKKRYHKAATYVWVAILTPVLVALLGTGAEHWLFGGASSPPPPATASHTGSTSAGPTASLPPQADQSPGGGQPVPGGSTVRATAPNSPARAEAVAPLNTEPETTRALAQKVQLTPSQLAQINKSYLIDHNPNYLPASLNSVPTGGGFIAVTVTGNAKGIVTISGIRVIKRCQAPLSGTLFLSPAQGVQSTIGLHFNLDSSIDYARGARGVQVLPGDYFQAHVVTLKPGETRTFSLIVRTARHYCQFTFQMSVVTPSGTVIETIDSNGRPFGLTAMQPGGYSSYKALYIGGLMATLTGANNTGAWVQENPKTFKD